MRRWWRAAGGGSHAMHESQLPPRLPSSAPWTCVFRDELALSPYAPPAVLQCLPDSAAPQGFAAVCRLKPNVHGDACHVNGEVR